MGQIKVSKEVSQLRIALGLGGLLANDMTCELIIETQKELSKKGGKYSLRDAVDLEFRIKRKYGVIEKETKKQK